MTESLEQSTLEHPSAEEAIFCVNHPNTETLLRCNRCNDPICLKCAKLTDVGYRCPNCLRQVQSKYFNAEDQDNPIAFGVGFLVTLIAAPIVAMLITRFGLFFGLMIAFIAGSGAGGALAQIIRSAVGKRRGLYLRHFAVAGIISGLLIGILIAGFIIGGLGGAIGFVLLLFSPSGWPMLLFSFLVITTVVGILR
ncbi:MAG: hypothetical protein AAF702_09665 [Chloroflexota bacterium]